jgi:hypothetical protein
VGDAPGWHPDPTGRHELRYHNGVAWTADVADGGARFVDPAGADGSAVGPTTTATGAPPSPGNGPAMAAMVLGIVAVAIAWLPFVVAAGVAAAVLALVFGVIGLRRAERTGVRRGPAVVGLVTGGLGLGAGAVGVVLTVVVVRAIDAYDDPNPHEVALTACTTAAGTTTAEGSLVNLGATEGDFVVRVEFLREGTDNVRRRVRVALDDVPAGGAAPFVVERPVGVEEVSCRIGAVTGPLPFGLDLE